MNLWKMMLRFKADQKDSRPRKEVQEAPSLFSACLALTPCLDIRIMDFSNSKQNIFSSTDLFSPTTRHEATEDTRRVVGKLRGCFLTFSARQLDSCAFPLPGL